MQGEVEAHFGQHPDAEIYLSQPGLGAILGARVLAEFGDDPHRYADAKARKNYAGTSPITRASGKKKSSWPATSTTTASSTPSASQAFSALTASPGARAYYDQLRARGPQATTPRCASSPTDSSASSTAASRPAPSTTSTPPGATASSRPLDKLSPWMLGRSPQIPDLLAASKAHHLYAAPQIRPSLQVRTPGPSARIAPRSAPPGPGVHRLGVRIMLLTWVELWGFEPQTSCMP